ncbi:RluA family pseudouridine synthase [Hoeflea poritis]|uniref:Pseudouridine synthase n=1 Tax=Hoeflea poritis TaxID=2993659 RepID=A0ABT4VV79_9HYPH|nr:RluA family pseudouridine synthase [Hoeflea poritis]MDA4847883.1 RluA family pseudouridine synthase [Hoeflea poritis]
MTEPFTQAPGERKVLIADESASGRLDAWLAAALAGAVSRSRIQALIKEGSVSVNGSPVREARHKISPGDSVELRLPEPEDATPEPENIPLDIFFEDDDVIVIAKPAGLVVHPGAGNHSGTLVNALLYHCRQSLSGIGGVRRPGIVHRLDKNTSGVMVVAKNDFAHNRLAEQFADHGRNGPLRRAYLALVWGRPEQLKGTIDAPMGRSGSDRTKRSVHHAGRTDSRHAVTHYEVRRRYGESGDRQALASLVECSLETGRTHQIRVHMQHIGHPLIGDPEYGGAFRTKVNKLPDQAAAAVTALRRQALHAYLLQFAHPRDGRTLRFEAPAPSDMASVIDALSML